MSSTSRTALATTAVTLAILLGVLLVLAPAEARLGHLIKLVYIHAALVWVGMMAFTLAGILGFTALVVRRPIWYQGTEAAANSALILWILYSLSAVLVTGLTWGQWIAWSEPRVRVTASILAAAVLLALAVRLVRNADLTAVASILLGFASWIAVERAEAIRHPVDPIGGSGSAAIQAYAALIMATVGGLALVLLLWLWASQRAAGVRGKGEAIDGR